MGIYSFYVVTHALEVCSIYGLLQLFCRQKRIAQGLKYFSYYIYGMVLIFLHLYPEISMIVLLSYITLGFLLSNHYMVSFGKRVWIVFSLAAVNLVIRLLINLCITYNENIDFKVAVIFISLEVIVFLFICISHLNRNVYLI